MGRSVSAPSRAMLAGLAAALASAAGLALADDGDGRRAAMGNILDSVQVVTARSASLERFSAAGSRDEVMAALGEIGDQAAMLAEHAGARSDEEEFLASALERYATWTRRAYERGEHARALAMYRQLTDLCVACHTRRRAAGSSLRARAFVESEDLAALAPRERARLQVATRQFTAALATLESALPSAPADDPLLLADLTTYVVVAVRVLGDDARALALVRRVAARDDLPPALGAALAQWIADLEALVSTPAPATLASAERLFARAEARPGGAGVVDYAAASEIGQELLDGRALTPAEFASVYLLLGISQMRLDPRSWIPRAELHLEQAIRAAPGTATAERAYDALTERLTAAYEGEPGRVPPEVAEHLERLRVLARTGKARPS